MKIILPDNPNDDKKRLVRRMIAGLAVMALGILLLIMPDRSGMEEIPRLFAVGGCAMLVFGGLGYILDAVWMAFYGLFIALMAGLPRFLPQPWSGLCVLAVMGCMFILPRAIAKFRKQAGEPEAIAKDVEIEPGPFPELIAERSGTLYQIVRGDDSIYVIALGEKMALKPEKALHALEDFTPGRGRQRIEFRDIDAVHVCIEEDGAHIRLKTSSKVYRWISEGADTAEIEAMFGGLSLTFGSNKRGKLTSAQRRRKEELQATFKVLRVISWIAALVFLIVAQPYRVLAIINLGIPIIVLVLYARNLKDLELFGRNARQNITFGSWVMSGCAVMMRALMDYNLRRVGQLFVPAAVAAAVCIIAFVLLSLGQKKRFKQVLCFLLCVVLVVPFGMILVNSLLPVRNAEVFAAVILEKDIHSSHKGPDWYKITLRTDEFGMLEVNTSREIYDQLEIGDETAYLMETSILGIETGCVVPLSALEE